LTALFIFERRTTVGAEEIQNVLSILAGDEIYESQVRQQVEEGKFCGQLTETAAHKTWHTDRPSPTTPHGFPTPPLFPAQSPKFDRHAALLPTDGQ
jgi:hypothetical protein